jgi:uncharacterized protein
MVRTRRVKLALTDAPVDAVTAAIHQPASRRGPGVLLTPGAGGDLDSEGLVALAEVLTDLGLPTIRANLPHRELGRRAAPRAESAVAPYRRIVEAARERLPDVRDWILGGKSYGGRVASLAVADGVPALGLLFYGYPLHPPGKPEKLRVSHWPDIGVPALFLQGDHDSFCSLDLLDAHVRKLPRRATVHVVAGGDHSLKVTAKASPTSQASSPAATIRSLSDVISAWVRSLES